MTAAPRDPVHVSQDELEEDRFHRFGLIQWWDQATIAATIAGATITPTASFDTQKKKIM